MMSDSSDRHGEADAGSAGASNAPMSRAELRAARELEEAAAAAAALTAAAEAAKVEAESAAEATAAEAQWARLESLAAAEAERASAAEGEQAGAETPDADAGEAAQADAVAPAAGGAADDIPATPIPDQIAPRRAPAPVDRPPEPIVYRPVSSAYVGDLGRPLPEPTARNVPARIALVLLPLAALGGVSVVVWWQTAAPTVAGVVALVSLTFAVAAFFLAIGGLVVAVQRPTKKTTSIVALVLSLLLVVWLGVMTVTQALAIVT